mmetsp:Transcript_55341/g.154136  ORF Transcript_55341/g.154136 Transcript_55341/m.154136 type:complete len:248 (+) Transcript_55341:218-961(+)
MVPFVRKVEDVPGLLHANQRPLAQRQPANLSRPTPERKKVRTRRVVQFHSDPIGRQQVPCFSAADKPLPRLLVVVERQATVGPPQEKVCALGRPFEQLGRPERFPNSFAKRPFLAIELAIVKVDLFPLFSKLAHPHPSLGAVGHVRPESTRLPILGSSKVLQHLVPVSIEQAIQGPVRFQALSAYVAAKDRGVVWKHLPVLRGPLIEVIHRDFGVAVVPPHVVPRGAVCRSWRGCRGCRDRGGDGRS